MKSNSYGNLFVGVSIRVANEITKSQIYKTGVKEDARFVAYFVVQGLGNCAYINRYKE